VLSLALALGAGAVAGAAALWPAIRGRLASVVRAQLAAELPHRPDPAAGPSPRRHHAAQAHTGSIDATAILAALKAGQTTDQVIAGITRRKDDRP
jgi:hypothetical protein